MMRGRLPPSEHLTADHFARTLPERLLLEELGRGDGSYFDTYPDLLAAAAKLATGDDGDVAAIANLAYGWMPRVLRAVDASRRWPATRRDLAALGRSAVAVRDVRDGVQLLKDRPSRAPIHGSWVGLSKFLHFLNPEVFPIWDSKVAAHWPGNNEWHNRKRVYLDYLEFCHHTPLRRALIPRVNEAIKSCEREPVTPIRALELALFISSPANKK